MKEQIWIFGHQAIRCPDAPRPAQRAAKDELITWYPGSLLSSVLARKPAQ
jgi:hypothetical protein